jgi:hypothetical protein
MEHSPIDQTTAEELALDPAGWTPERRARFIELLSESGVVRASARACGLSPQSVYKLRRRDALFERSWKAALVLARDHSEQVMACRALDGVEEPIFYRGEQVGVRRRYDTRLLLAHMARLDRQCRDSQAKADAGRFDELLALVAGEELPEALAEVAVDVLPPERVRYPELAVEALEDAFFGADKFIDETRRGAFEEEMGEAADAAFEKADAEWSAWFAQACAAVDRLDQAEPSFHARTASTVSTAAMAQAQAQAQPYPVGWGGVPIYARA